MKRIAIFALACAALHADSKEGIDPLYAGTQLAYYPINGSPGHVSINPFITYSSSHASYGSHWTKETHTTSQRVIGFNSIATGITNWWDATIYFGGQYQKVGCQHTWGLLDTTLNFGFQLLRGDKNNWIPDIRLIVGETFPTGKYDRLDLRKKGSDLFGAGSYVTSVVFIMARTFYVIPKHPFNLNLNLYYNQPSSTTVRGLNYYGGDPETKGKVFPKSSFVTNLAIELSLNRFWALGMDMSYIHTNKVPFKGHTILKTGFPSSEQFSLAPCLEYCWTETACLALGPWFTVAGRNSSAFAGFLTNAYWYF